MWEIEVTRLTAIRELQYGGKTTRYPSYISMVQLNAVMLTPTSYSAFQLGVHSTARFLRSDFTVSQESNLAQVGHLMACLPT
jgi:hypothetical protein